MGSRFTVELPQGETTEAPVGKPRPRPPPAGARHRRVLVVDDNEDAADAVAEALHGAGYETIVAYDAPSALRKSHEQPIDAAVLDLGLPVMDGYELASRLRSERAAPGPRLIALTGYGQEKDLQRSKAAGFDEHLVKPIALDTLLDVLGRQLAS
jgi:CheY-like chemotaxis protein